jgi:diguanylate cyclase (GGDEF)-like protein
MGLPSRTLRLIADQFVPGGLLLVATWAVQREEVIHSAAAPYAPYYCAAALVVAVLLSWYYDQSQLLCSAAAIALTVLVFERSLIDFSDEKRAALFLLPLNLSLFAVWKERGVMTFNGLLKAAIVCVQVLGVLWIGSGDDPGARGLAWIGAFSTGTGLPLMTQAAFAAGALTLLVLVIRRQTKVEQGLLWALVAMFLGVNQLDVLQPASDALLFYSGTAGLVLVFAVLEHGYDIAYRDELTGLPGRRAFNSVMGQLGGAYTIAMCDVDHFKRFNDTYGHDAGDQVLHKVASRLSRVGGGGRAFRYGGEEFLIVFRGLSAGEAEPFLETLRSSLADEGFVIRGADRPRRKPRSVNTSPGTNAPRVQISVSIGLAERSKRHSTPELVLDAADAALYRAKEAGRNCVKRADIETART